MKNMKQFWAVCAICSAVTGAAALHGLSVRPVQAQEAAASNQLTVESLGTTLQSLGLQVTPTQSRYDFRFSSTLEGEQWNLTMSAVLSEDGKTLWLMAWLDKLPDSASDVPVTRLLEMLAANDRMGNGKFFSYLPGSRRFALQRVLPNHDLDKAAVAHALQDLGMTVRAEYGIWATAGWTQQPVENAAPAAAPIQDAAVNDSKFSTRSIR